MPFEIDDQLLADGLAERELGKRAFVKQLLGENTVGLRSHCVAAVKDGFTEVPGESTLQTIERLVDFRYPSVRQAGTVPPFQPSASGLVVAEPAADPHQYRDIAGETEVYLPPTGMRDVTKELGGFDPEVLSKTRAFVGYRDKSGTVVKLPVIGVQRVSGFDADSRSRRSVLIVDLPKREVEGEIDSNFMKTFLGDLMGAAHTGEPESMLDAIIELADELGWNSHELSRWKSNHPALLGELQVEASLRQQLHPTKGYTKYLETVGDDSPQVEPVKGHTKYIRTMGDDSPQPRETRGIDEASVKKLVTRALDAAYSGSHDKVLSVLNEWCDEYGWDVDELFEEFIPKEVRHRDPQADKSESSSTDA